MCIVIDDFSGLMQRLLSIQSSENGFFKTGYFTTDVYNSLKIVLIFLTDVPKPTCGGPTSTYCQLLYRGMYSRQLIDHKINAYVFSFCCVQAQYDLSHHLGKILKTMLL